MAMEKIIIINSGSVSKKYALYENDNKVVSYHYEDSKDGYLLHISTGNVEKEGISINDSIYKSAFEHFVDELIREGHIRTEMDIEKVAFRVVAPGEYFTYDRVIDQNFLEKLEEANEQTPLHIGKLREEISDVADRLGEIKRVAISDSRFHKTMPDYAKIYALPKKIRDEFGIRRFGYHGISVGSIAHILKERKGLSSKIIVCHLGGGSSITAMKDGHSIDTTMGYSPLEGLTMSTRVGPIGPGALLTLMDLGDFDLKEMREMLNFQSGLKGISNNSSDVRIILEEIKNGDDESKLAMDNYIYNIQKVIGSYYTLLGGLDILVFTGTIGERSEEVRQMICEKVSVLGVDIEKSLNHEYMSKSGFINKAGSEVSVLVLETDEMTEMARRAVELS